VPSTALKKNNLERGGAKKGRSISTTTKKGLHVPGRRGKKAQVALASRAPKLGGRKKGKNGRESCTVSPWSREKRGSMGGYGAPMKGGGRDPSAVQFP